MTTTLRIGITGGIGSGKTYVSNLLRDKGYKVFDCDSWAKKLMTEDLGIIRRIQEVVGENAYHNISTEADERKNKYVLNKKFLADFLFKDDKNAQIINRIVHPKLAEQFVEWADRQEQAVVFIESAILFESGFNELVDYSILVFADINLRIQRVVHRDTTSQEAVISRINRQVDSRLLIKKADFVICNNQTDDVEEQLNSIIDRINLLNKNRQ